MSDNLYVGTALHDGYLSALQDIEQSGLVGAIPLFRDPLSLYDASIVLPEKQARDSSYQHIFTSAADEKIYAQVLEISPPDVKASIMGASVPGASDFITCLPTSESRVMNDAEFGSAMHIRFGLQRNPHAPADVCACGVDVSHDPAHAMVCVKLAAAEVRRHDRLVDAVMEVCKASGAMVAREVPPPQDAADQLRPDLTVVFGGPAPRVVYLDVTVTHPASRGRLPRAGRRLVWLASLNSRSVISMLRLLLAMVLMLYRLFLRRLVAGSYFFRRVESPCSFAT